MKNGCLKRKKTFTEVIITSGPQRGDTNRTARRSLDSRAARGRLVVAAMPSRLAPACTTVAAFGPSHDPCYVMALAPRSVRARLVRVPPHVPPFDLRASVDLWRRRASSLLLPLPSPAAAPTARTSRRRSPRTR